MKSNFMPQSCLTLWQLTWLALAFGATANQALAQASTSDLWDLAQGTVVTSSTSINGGSDRRDILGGVFSAQEAGYTVFQDGSPTSFAHTIEWQSPDYVRITNCVLYLTSDVGGANPGMRAIGSFKLYAHDGTAFQLIYASNNIPSYAGNYTISAQFPAAVATRWRAEFTPVNIGPFNGPRILELDGWGTAVAALNIPTDGSDGALSITNNTIIDLSQAVTGLWSDNNSANAGKGVYDPAKWAVVFKYSSVNIAAGATVTFSNHPSRAPVVWLVQSNVTIGGSLSLSGNAGLGSSPGYLTATEPGPGGFRGGALGPQGAGSGYGPGGKPNGGPGSATYTGTYGNPQILPLLGGSGANGGVFGFNVVSLSGASGGGAILIVAAGNVSVGGSIAADAGITYYYDRGSLQSIASSGGAVRIVANQVLGAGSINANRVRVEANGVSQQIILTPNTTAVPPGATPAIWPPDNTPIVKILGINGQPSPVDPLAAITTSSDISIGTNSPVDIFLVTSNFPPSGAVSLRVVPKYATYFNVNASFVSGTFSNAFWKATATLPTGFSVLQAHATSQ